MKIDNKQILDSDNRVYFIGDIGLCHNGEIEIAKKLIDVAVTAGVDAVKFQKRTVEELATKEVLDEKDDRFPNFGKTYRQIREYLEFDEEQYGIIFDYCKQKSITCFVTPFDISSLNFFDDFDVPAYKIASHSVTDIPLVKHIARKGKPVIISSGMIELEELDNAVNIIRNRGIDYAILHCVSSYPTDISQANLKMIDTLYERYKCPVGFSGHETDNIVTLSAAARGARIIERHITLDHSMEGFDHKIALKPAELTCIIKEIRKIEMILGDGIKKIADYEMATRNKYRRSIASKVEINKDETITADKLIMLNPGTGIHPNELKNIIGKKSKANIKKGVLLEEWMY